MAQLLELQLWSAAPRGPSQNRKSLPPHLVTKRSKSASIEEEGPANQPDLFIGGDPGLSSATEGGYLGSFIPTSVPISGIYRNFTCKRLVQVHNSFPSPHQAQI